MAKHRLSIRRDLDGYLADLTIHAITEFEGVISGRAFTGRVVAGGFGNPHIILTLSAPRVELALVESEEYQQDGDDPLEAEGWRWRREAPDPDRLLTADWSRIYPTASQALAAALAAESAG